MALNPIDRLQLLVVASLNERHRQVLALQMQGLSRDEIADKLGLTNERIRQIQYKTWRIIAKVAYREVTLVENPPEVVSLPRPNFTISNHERV